MKSNYNIEKAKDLKAPMKVVYQVNGEGGGCWSIICNPNNLEIHEGEMEDFEAKITYKDFESFYKIFIGEISGVKAYIKKLLTVSGSQSTLKKFSELVKA
jgi:hypothetical protein